MDSGDEPKNQPSAVALLGTESETNKTVASRILRYCSGTILGNPSDKGMEVCAILFHILDNRGSIYVQSTAQRRRKSICSNAENKAASLVASKSRVYQEDGYCGAPWTLSFSASAFSSAALYEISARMSRQ